MRKLLLLLVLLTAISTTSFAANPPPVLCATDLAVAGNTGMIDNLPSTGFNHGAIVTVWGQNLGSSQGTSTITVGGVTPSYIYYWKNADGNLPGGPAVLTKLNMQEIAFAISPSTPGSTAGTPNNIVVTVNGVSSSPLSITIVSGYTSTITSSGGNFIFVSNSGSDSSSCGTLASPCATFNNYSSLGNGSNTGQTYYTLGNYTLSGTGTNSEGLITLGHDCTAQNPCAVIAYPNTTFTINSTNTYANPDTAINAYNNGSTLYPATNVVGNSTYWTLIKINSSMDGFFAQNLGIYCRIVGNAISSTNYLHTGAGVIGGWAGGGFYAMNYFHNIFAAGNAQTGGNGPDNQTHVLYFTHRRWGNFKVPLQAEIVRWNYFYNNTVRFAVHFYDEHMCGQVQSGSVVDSNWIELEDGAAVGFTGAGCDDAPTATSYGEPVCSSGCFSGPNQPIGFTGPTYGFNVGTVTVTNNTLIETGLNRNGASPQYMSGFYLSGAALQGNIISYNNTIWSTGQSLISGMTYNNCKADAQAATGQINFCTSFLVDHACQANITWSSNNDIVFGVLGQPYGFFYNDSSTGRCYGGVMADATVPTGTNSLFFDSSGTPSGSWGTNAIVNTQNPNFTNISTDNFLPTSTPPLGSGFHSGSTPVYDILGNSRPNPPAIGAVDIGGGSGPPPPSWLKGGYWWQAPRYFTTWCYTTNQENTGASNNSCRYDQ